MMHLTGVLRMTRLIGGLTLFAASAGCVTVPSRA